MVTISACMIVKNEERILDRCLNSLAGIVDEIIIVDTGSTDETKRIAAKYTDRVYDFAWTGSFSDARNFAFSKAQMDYIYSADADEMLDEENRAAFLRMKEVLLPEIEIVQMYYVNQLANGTIYNYDKELRPKLYKRNRTFQWQGAIHEQVGITPVIYDSEICIQHLPEENHKDRDLAAFVRLTEAGEPLDKRLHNIYAKELFISGEPKDFSGARAFFQESCKDGRRGADELMEAACVAARAARLAGDVADFFKYAMKAVASGGCAEVCCELGAFYMERKDYDEAIIWLYNAAYETESILDIHSGGDLPLRGLAKCYQELGNAEQAAEYTRLAAEWSIEGEKKA
ncbi:MAG: glycosyltransferase [Bacteroidales bacterium]|nr:glycosyltransferase [Bacteroidales bacterium]MCM1416985.1 glycosyltransferase [bacterium]MCM1422830.1 glycosyltransferase [bacterium]